MKRYLVACLILSGAAVLPLFGQSATEGTIRRLDPALNKILPPEAKIEKLAGNFRFVEGPVWDRRGRFLLFSDIPANAIMKWSSDGTLSTFRKNIFTGSHPDGALVGTNGLTLDRQGRIVAAEHGNRRVSRIEKNGSVTVLADHYEGKRLNSPNDVVVRKNGEIYFTDPPYGLFRSNPPDPAKDPQRELDFNGIYRIKAGKVELLAKTASPNGLAFSPDEKRLYINNSDANNKIWYVYDVKSDGTLHDGRILYESKDTAAGVPDGLRIDKAGILWSSGPGGINIISPGGKLLGLVQFPEVPANCAWGDDDGKTLYVTARTSLYRIRTNVEGIRP